MENPITIQPDGSHSQAVHQPFDLFAWARERGVGDTLELVDVLGEPGKVLLVDEDGLLNGSAYNPTASGLAGRSIVGTVVLVDRRALR